MTIYDTIFGKVEVAVLNIRKSLRVDYISVVSRGFAYTALHSQVPAQLNPYTRFILDKVELHALNATLSGRRDIDKL